MATLLPGVKALADNGIAELPKNYIKPVNLRVNEAEISLLEDIPVIDISQLSHGDHRSHVVKAIADAADNWGFFQVIKHGVPLPLMTSMKKVTREFFDSPIEDKMLHYAEDFRKPIRYCTSFSPSTETYLEWQDHLQHNFPPHGEDHPWPQNPPSYKGIAKEYVKEVSALAKCIESALSEGLGLDSNYFDKAFGHHHISMKLNYYPPCPNPELAMGRSAHSDFGGLTILMQDEVGGLQARHQGKWCPVRPLGNAFVVNISDQLQIWSNGKYKSAEHRVVVNSTKSRISVATFFQPSGDVVVAPIPELIDDMHPPLYKETLFGEYLRNQFTVDSKNGIKSRLVSDPNVQSKVKDGQGK